MIARRHRFHGRNSLNFVYRQGHQVHLPEASLKVIENNRRQTYRVAVVVSKKISKSAVVRNRIRRRLYEAVRQREDRLQKPFDMVIVVFSEQLATAPAKTIDDLINSLFSQAHID